MSIRTEVIDLLDPLLAGRVAADRLPERMNFPAAAVIDSITEVAELRGDGRAGAWRRLMQVDLWERTGRESAVLLDQVLNVLDGARLTEGLRLSVSSCNRIPDPDVKIVHHAITASVARLRS